MTEPSNTLPLLPIIIASLLCVPLGLFLCLFAGLCKAGSIEPPEPTYNPNERDPK